MSDIQTGRHSDSYSPGTGAAGAIAVFGEQIFIHSEKPLAQFDQGPVRAYAASGLSDVSQVTHLAMICQPNLTPRIQSAAAYATINSPNLVKLVAFGPVYWPPTRSERYAFIYEMPPGRMLCNEGEFTGLSMRPETVLNAVLRPLTYALGELRDADMGHGNIRPSTILGTGASIDRVILTDCLSSPSSYNQKIMFESIERAMADPLGRGPAIIADDLYAVGVTLAVLLRSRDPVEGLSDEDIIRHKIEHGSLATLTGKDRISGNIIELLRGLLHDDRVQRWTLDDINMWLDGQHLSPKQGLKRSKAARPIHFHNERYFRPAMLAMDLNNNQSEAAQLVETKTLEQWISRSLEDTTVLKRLETAIGSAEEQGHGPGYWDRLICRVSVALDPEAPLRYKGVSVFPDSIGLCLADALINRTDPQPYIDLINQQMPMYWATAQADENVDLGSIVSRFDACRAFMRQNNIAYGVERCLYFLNPNCHCLSEKLRGHYVKTPEDVLRAFEKIATQPNRPELFLDRHIIAFLSVKDRQDVDAFLIELNAEETYRKILGNIKTLATIQQRSRMEKLPGICKWISEILGPVYERFHDRELRQTLKNKAAQYIEGGDIAKITGLLNNPQTLAHDTENYNQARVEYYNMRLESNALEKKLNNPKIFAKGTGQEIAAFMSCILSVLAILFFIFMVFTKGSVF